MAADTLGGVDFDYLAKNTRVNVAGVATMALAPAAPVRWIWGAARRSDEARPGTMRTCAGSARPVPPAIESSGGKRGPRTGSTSSRSATRIDYVLEDISIDDYVFGVAAIGAEGHESLVSAYVRAPRARSDIREVGR